LPGLAALLWVKLPGESDGICGGETNYLFSPTQAQRLISNSPTVPEAERQLAAAAHVPPTTDDSIQGDYGVGVPRRDPPDGR
jgi:endoglucanase